MQEILCKLEINLNESFIVQGWMLQKKAQVVSESMYLMVLIAFPTREERKPLESLFATLFRAGGVGDCRWNPVGSHCLLHIFVQGTKTKNMIKTFCIQPGWALFQLYPLSASQQQQPEWK